MLLVLNKNRLKDEVDNVENYIYFSVRNAKVLQIAAFIENYFRKKNKIVKTKVSHKEIRFEFYKKETDPYPIYENAYIKLDRINICNSVLNTSYLKEIDFIKTRSNRMSKNTIEIFDNLDDLHYSLYFNDMVKELNYPFSLEKLEKEKINCVDVLKNKFPTNFISDSIKEGEKAGKETVCNLISNDLLKKGIFSNVKLIDDETISVEIVNTKRGTWKNEFVTIKIKENYSPSSWHKEIDYKTKELVSINMEKTVKKETVFYKEIVEYINSKEFKENVKNNLRVMHYPFYAPSYFIN